MACRLTLPFWPTSVDCIKWSHDNQLAIAGGERIAILSPCLKGPAADGTYWDKAIFRANSFTSHEVPRADPPSFANSSVGEELSTWQVQALEWSSPGPARHGGCLLAVLTTNHVLSIWECEGRAEVASNWKRKAVVNHVIRDYYKTLNRQVMVSDDTENVTRQHESRLLQQRIRAFAWSPPLYEQHDGKDEQILAHLSHGDQFLAVSTQVGDLLLVRAQTPHHALDLQVTEWRVDVVSKFNASAQVTSTAHRPANTDTAYVGADAIAWSAWDYKTASRGHSTLSYIANGSLFHLDIEVDASSELPEVRVSAKCDRLQSSSSTDRLSTVLLRYIRPRRLVMFSPNMVICQEPPNTQDHAPFQYHHHLDEQWDEISGLAVTANSQGQQRIHLVWQLSTAVAQTAVVQVPCEPDAISPAPSWQQAIVECKAAYSAEHDLGGYVQERTWGIATSPLSEYIATCITLHPSDAVAAITPSSQQCVINISREGDTGESAIPPQGGGSFGLDGVPAETLLFSLQQHVQRIGQPSVSNSADATQWADIMMGTVVNMPESIDKEICTEGDVNVTTLVRYLKTQIFRSAHLRKARLRYLAAMALGHDSSTDKLLLQVAQRLVSKVPRLPEASLQSSELSMRIVRLYTKVQAKLGLAGDKHVEGMAADSRCEECCICKSEVRLESLKWARCETGHHFGRCGVTFLAIQEPGLAKSCRVCGSQYLDGTRLPGFMCEEGQNIEMRDLLVDQEQAKGKQNGSNDQDLPHLVDTQRDGSNQSFINGPQAAAERSDTEGWVEVSRSVTAAGEPPNSLVRILFAAFDMCVLCGGKLGA